MVSGHMHGRHRGGQDGATGPVRDAAYWDERYRSASALWSGQPNVWLVAETGALEPGRALEMGCGEGADAIWLAQRGWQVTAVDISAVALDRAAARAAAEAAEAAGRITWRPADLTEWAPDAGRYDLVTMHFVHLPPRLREMAFARLGAAVAPGGTLLVVGHHPRDLQLEGIGPREPELFFTGDDVVASLGPGEWRIVVNAARARDAEDPEGRPVTTHTTVLRAERLSGSGPGSPNSLNSPDNLYDLGNPDSSR